MNEIASTNDRLAELRMLTVEQLEDRLKTLIATTASGLMEMALIVKCLEESGKDVTELRISMVHVLRKIACGQLLPEIVVRFYGFPCFRRIANLPISDQQLLAAGDPVKIAERVEATGDISHRLMDPLRLDHRDAAIVFATDHIRTVEEQAVVMHRARQRAAAPAPETVGSLRIDHARGGAMIGRHFVSASDMETALRILKRGKPAPRA